MHRSIDEANLCPFCKGSGEMTVSDTSRGPYGENYIIDCDKCSGTGTAPVYSRRKE